MNTPLLLAGLPVTLAASGASVFLMAWGWTIPGLVVLVLAVVSTMFIVGQGMPRPVVVPRPGEEEQYAP